MSFEGARARVAGATGLAGGGVTSGEVDDAIALAIAALDVPDDIGDLVDLSGAASGDHLVYDGADVVAETPAAITFTSDIGYSIDGGGSVVTTGNKHGVRVDFAGTLTGYTMMSPDVTTTEVDLWATTSYPPTNAQSITGGNEMSITATTVHTDTTLTSWTTAFAAGTYFWFNVDSNSAATWLGIALKFTRSVGP